MTVERHQSQRKVRSGGSIICWNLGNLQLSASIPLFDRRQIIPPLPIGNLHRKPRQDHSREAGAERRAAAGGLLRSEHDEHRALGAQEATVYCRESGRILDVRANAPPAAFPSAPTETSNPGKSQRG